MNETPPPAPPPAPVPAKSGNRTLIIILCVFLGILLLIGGCVATCTYIVARKAKELGREAQRNPAFVSLSLAASLDPDIQVVSKDENSGKITLKNKKTGEVVTIDTTQYTAENIGKAFEKFAEQSQKAAATMSKQMTASDDSNGKSSSSSSNASSESESAPEPKISAGKAAALAATLKKFPSYVPAYSGGTTTEASQTVMGAGKFSNYVFLTSDKPETVVDFYEKKLTGAGFTALGRNNDSNDNGPTSSAGFAQADSQGTASITAETQEGGRVKVSVVLMEATK
jgi:hypothetical protein